MHNRFVLASEHMTTARQVTRWWNRHHQDRYVPWEWVEEAMIAYLRARHNGPTDDENRARFNEFSRRLPKPIIDQLFLDIQPL